MELDFFWWWRARSSATLIQHLEYLPSKGGIEVMARSEFGAGELEISRRGGTAKKKKEKEVKRSRTSQESGKLESK